MTFSLTGSSFVGIDVTGSECIRVDDASGQEVEADAGRPPPEPSGNVRALVSAGEQICSWQWRENGLGVLL